MFRIFGPVKFYVCLIHYDMFHMLLSWDSLLIHGMNVCMYVQGGSSMTGTNWLVYTISPGHIWTTLYVYHVCMYINKSSSSSEID